MTTAGEGVETGLGRLGTCDVVVVAQAANLADYTFRRLGSYQLIECRGTQSPLAHTIRLITGTTPAMRLLERIKSASDLTFENIAPLAGVSRRSVQSWRAGEAISQRNEEHLRALAEAIETIAAANPLNVRDRLMERVSGSIRIYDLLAEGRYQDAIARATGTRPAPHPIAHSAPPPLSVALAAQVGALESPATTLDHRIDKRFTKRLKR